MKKDKKKEERGIVLYAQNQGSHYYVDNGCSKHITEGKRKFMLLNENKIGSVIFCNDAPYNIKGKGIARLENGRDKSQNVLFV